jgi:hypothetical protein
MTPRRGMVYLWLIVLGALATVGCGDKIMIPQPRGLFSVAPYLLMDTYADQDPRQLITVQGNLFVLTSGALTKRNQNYIPLFTVEDLGDPRALCSDDADSLVFVWDEDRKRVSWYRSRDLSPPVDLPRFSDLPAVQTCVGMVACRAGIEQVPGAATFVYLADPDSGVVHRYAYDPFIGLSSHGILCRSDGVGTRFVHEPAGLARDHADSLLVCDRDLARNWVIRFDAVPDLTDLATGGGEDPMRGHAAIFDEPTCNPPAAIDYVLGDAASCNQTDWVGGPSDEIGAFTAPAAVAVDGSGRIFVADTGNDRIQVFSPRGHWRLLFGNSETLPQPTSLAVVDVRIGSGPDDVNHAAYVYVVSEGSVLKFISGDHLNHLNLPPHEL